MAIKAIVVDLDRTLLHTDKTISPYTAEVFKKCKQKGIALMVATARPYRTMTQFCEIIDFDAISATNGARIICGDYRKEYGLCPASAERVLTALKSYPDYRVTLETGEEAYSNKPIEDYFTVISDDLAAVARSEGAIKILISLDTPDILETVKKMLTDDLYYTVANGHLIQIMSRAVTKWNGVKDMLDISNISASETAYFGDDYDDIEPIRMCGVGVAVSNAIDEVKAVADHIAESNDDDGVAKFIERYIL
jgi:Cof subfamily protein (haloacid dehalogenase superfamily)